MHPTVLILTITFFIELMLFGVLVKSYTMESQGMKTLRRSIEECNS